MYRDMDGKLSVDELMGWDMKFQNNFSYLIQSVGD